MMVISNEPELIMNDINIIYRPKPKKVYKSNFELSPKSNTISNQDSKTHGKKHKNRKKHENLNLNLKKNGMTKSQNFDLISFEEIENDFKLLKAKSEMVQVQNELLKLLENSTIDTSFDEEEKKKKVIKRPKNLLYNNCE
jgi:hypothetical protein